MVELLRQVVPATALVVAVDPGKVSNRVWLTSGERGLIGEPVSLPVLREGVDTLAELIATSGVAGAPIRPAGGSSSSRGSRWRPPAGCTMPG